MKVVVTAREIFDSPLVGAWDKACDMLGLDPYCVNEGLMDSDEQLTLTVEQAKELMILEKEV